MLNIFSTTKYTKTNRVVFFALIVCIVVLGLFSTVGTNSAYAQTSPTNSIQTSSTDCSGVGATFSASCNILKAFKFVARQIFDLSAWFATSAGELLDISLKFTLDSDTYQIKGIHVAWEIFRDLANMTFIFILLYIAAMTVLQLGGFETKKILASLIIVALLVNFSFFITRVVIDTGNVLGGFMYTALTPDVQVTTTTTLPSGVTTSVSSVKQRELGQTFMTAIKASSLLDARGLKDNGNNNEKLIMIYLLGAVVFLVAGFVFLAGSVLFFIRTVTLLFLIFISPIAFVAAILPKTNTYWSTWFGKLIGNSFVAPIYLVLISVVVVLASDDSLFKAATDSYNSTKGAGAPDLNSAQTLLGVVNIQTPDYTLASSSAIIITYVVMIGLLIAALTVSQNVAGGLAARSTNWTKKMLGFGVRAAGAGAGGAGFIGRHTVGRGLQALTQSERFQKRASESFAGRQVMRLANVGAKASYDARSGKVASAVGVAAGGALGAAGVKTNVGTASGKGGFKKRNEDLTKKRTTREADIARSLGEDASIVGPAQTAVTTAEDDIRNAKLTGSSDIVIKGLERNLNNKEAALQNAKLKRQEKYLKDVGDRKWPKLLSTLRTKHDNTKIVRGARQELKKDQTRKDIEGLQSLLRNQGQSGTTGTNTP